MEQQLHSQGERAGAGLCADCRYARRIASQRGSLFYLCERSFFDASYPKYPSLPVLQCPGYVASSDKVSQKLP